ncbi:MAG: Tn7 transposase TnsA N-terminal domain-containing protein [Dehalococcoidia bacterium]
MQSKRGRLSNLHKTPGGAAEYDSHLERDYMEELDHDPRIREWTRYHNIKIPYRLLGIPRNYHPDFLLTFNDGSQELHETKGLPLMFWLSTKLKRQSAEAYCASRGWKYKMVTTNWKRRGEVMGGRG